MPGLALALLVAAAPEPLKVSGPVFEVQGVPEAEVQYWSAVFANDLRQQGLQVGPNEGAELKAAGELKRVGPSGLQIDVRLEKPTGEAIASFTMTALTDAELRGLFTAASQELAGEAFRRLSRSPTRQKLEPLPAAPARSTRTLVKGGVMGGILVAGLGVGGLAAGLGLYLVAKDKLSAVARGQPESYFAAQQQTADAKAFSTASLALLGAGGLLFVGGVLYALYSGNVNTFIAVSPAVDPAGGGLVFSGAWP